MSTGRIDPGYIYQFIHVRNVNGNYKLRQSWGCARLWMVAVEQTFLMQRFSSVPVFLFLLCFHYKIAVPRRQDSRSRRYKCVHINFPIQYTRSARREWERGRGNGEGKECGNKPGENSIQIRKLALPFLSVAFQLKYSSVPGIECD